MRLESDIRIVGRFVMRVIDAESRRVVRKIAKQNLITNVGRNMVRDARLGEISHMAVGTSQTEPTVSDTTLGNEVYRDLLTQTDRDTDYEVEYGFYIPSAKANGNTLREAGLFTASSDGDMFAKIDFDAVDKTPQTNLQISWTISITANS